MSYMLGAYVIDIRLIYGGGELTVKGFTDASFHSDLSDLESQSEFIFFLKR